MRRNAALFVVISLLSGFGSTMMGLAASIWIFDLTGSVGLAALIGICTYGPSLAAPWLGALVDRLPRRPLLIWSDLILGVLFLTLLTIDSAAGVWLIFAVLLIRGVSYIVLDAGESALLPAALPPSLLGDVNGWRTSAQEGMKLLAPLAGAGLYAWRGPTPVILIGAAMPLLSAACYALIRLRSSAPAFAAAEVPAPLFNESDSPTSAGSNASASAGRDVPAFARRDAPAFAGSAGESQQHGGGDEVSPVATASVERDAPAFAGSDATASAGRDVSASTSGPGERTPSAASEERGIRPGIRLLLSEPAVRIPVLVAAVAITLSGVTAAAVLARIVHDLQLSAAHLGVLTSAQGAGSIVGGLIVGRLLARWSPTVIAGVGVVVFAGGVLTWCLPWWPAMIGGSVVVGLGLPWTLIAAVTAVQTKTPDHLLGRVAATSNMLMFGPIALAIPLGSAVVALGARPPLLAVGLLALLTAAAVLRAKTSAMRR